MITASNGMRYEPTAADRLWLMRAVHAEGEPREYVARALVNLFALTYKPGKTLAALVQQYAQPVNPKWAQQGTGAQRARRLAASTRTVFDRATQEAVAKALTTPFPSPLTDYAAPSVDATSKGYVAMTPASPGVNRLWTRSPKWSGYGVADSAAAGLGLIVLLAAVMLRAWKMG